VLTPPKTEKRPIEREHHGDVVVDEYEWLRAKDDPSVLAHLHEENAYTKARTEHLSLLQEQLFEEIRARTKETDLSVPTREGRWWYFTRTVEGAQYGIHCRVPATGDDWEPPVLPESTGDELADASFERLPGEQVLLDDNVEAEGHEYYALGSFDVTADGSTLLYGIDVEGDERYTIRLRSLDDSGREYDDVIEGTAAGAVFDPSGRYLFYATVDESWRPDTIWRHEVGTPASDDVSVFTEPDERFWLGVGVTRSRRFLMIEAGSNVTSETWLLDADDPAGEFRVVWPRKDGVEYDVEHVVTAGTDRLLVVHNDGAVNFELVSVAASDPQGPRRMLLPHNPAVRLEGVDAFRDFVAVEYRREGLPRVAIAKVPPAGLPADATPDDTLHELPFDEALFSVGVGSNPDWEQPSLRIGYSSFVTPTTVYDVVVETGERRLRKQQPVLGGYDPTRYSQRREWATAEDGTRVPISVVCRRGTPRDGSAPAVLYGYGSYEASMDPWFSIPRLSLLDRGVVFAVAHIRGGGEMGRRWYEDGKMLAKKNTFTDFVAAAQHMVKAGWSSADRLVARGGSAGGLLMGAVANLAPEAFAGIVAQVPFVDALNTILDPSLPLTVTEWEEWGNPLESAEVYTYMKSYTPYENVTDRPYPAILAVTSLNDTRVLFHEPAKWVARLRALSPATPVLLKTEMGAGHGGPSGRYDAWKEEAFVTAWMLDRFGLA
jgi:oligopeptidase B